MVFCVREGWGSGVRLGVFGYKATSYKSNVSYRIMRGGMMAARTIRWRLPLESALVHWFMMLAHNYDHVLGLFPHLPQQERLRFEGPLNRHSWVLLVALSVLHTTLLPNQDYAEGIEELGRLQDLREQRRWDWGVRVSMDRSITHAHCMTISIWFRNTNNQAWHTYRRLVSMYLSHIGAVRLRPARPSDEYV